MPSRPSRACWTSPDIEQSMLLSIEIVNDKSLIGFGQNAEQGISHTKRELKDVMQLNLRSQLMRSSMFA
jgi:hypothetical protein